MRAVILDAGSSGTRIYVYQWEAWTEGPLPQIEVLHQSDTPGASGGIAAQPHTADGVSAHLSGLFAAATAAVPSLDTAEVRATIPLFLLGTAGMRDFRAGNPAGYELLMREVGEYLARFGYASTECRVITGKEEALYGWVAANCSKRSFNSYRVVMDRTVGYVEMGGASTQIAFQPSVAEMVDYRGSLTRLSIGHAGFNVYARSFKFGADKAWNLHEATLRERDARDPAQDPCRPQGCDFQSSEGKPIIGVGNSYLKCIFTTNTILRKLWQPDDYTIHNPYPPANASNPDIDLTPLLGVNLLAGAPAVDFSRREFAGGAQFWYTLRQIFGRDGFGEPLTDPFCFISFRREAVKLVKKRWSELQGHGVDDRYLVKAFFVAAFITNVLYHALLFPKSLTGEPSSFQPYNGANGAALTWTLGKIALLATSRPGHEPVAVTAAGEVIPGAVWAADD